MTATRMGTTWAQARSGVLMRIGAGRAWLAFAIALVTGVGIVHPGLDRELLILALLPAIVSVAVLQPRFLLYGLVLWLVGLGLVRRIFDTISPASLTGLGDPFLLVEPAIILVLVVVASQRGAFKGRTILSNAVLAITCLAIIEVVNPLQGGPLVGLAGLLFLLVPILGFWVGRGLIDDRTLGGMLATVAGLGAAATAYGLFQQFSGYPSWDQAWITTSGYGALHVGQVIRAFGTFSNSAEYETFLGIGVIVCAASLTRRRIAPFAFALGVLIAFGAFYDSSRGIIVLGVAGLGVMMAARRQWSPVPAVLGGVAFLFALLLIAGHFAQGASGPVNGNSALVQHQLTGLASPFNSQQSTLSFHLYEMVAGFRSTIINPIGHGSGAISIAASRFGTGSQGTEVDPSNFGVALGIPGLIGYLIVATVGLWRTYRLATRDGNWWRLAAVGLLLVTFLQWSTGGEYATAWLPWLVLGWADRSWVREEATSRLLDSDRSSRRHRGATV